VSSLLTLDVVIVSHGAPDLLRACLRSLEAHPPKVSHRVTVVDSGSPDSTPEMVATEFPQVRLIACPNIGFSAANNLVLRETEAEFVLLLNPDTEITEGALESSMARIASAGDIGMVGCKLIVPSGELDHACKRSFPTVLGALAHFSGLGLKKRARESLSQYRATQLGDDEAGEVDAVNGAFMLVRREAVHSVGLLDEGYWLYMEDLDWCYRFWQRGWRVFYEPRGTVVHVKGGSSGARRRFRQELAFHRGMGRFYRKFYAPDRRPLESLAVYSGILLKLALSLAKTGLRQAAGPRG
jgi:N-acetylglucosaminyl-diphospho-decaprenol L-rhamnosyltransferase